MITFIIFRCRFYQSCDSTIHILLAACDPGYELVGGDCVPCALGFYKEMRFGTCQPCAFGTLTLGNASAAASDCYLSKYYFSLLD